MTPQSSAMKPQIGDYVISPGGIVGWLAQYNTKSRNRLYLIQLEKGNPVNISCTGGWDKGGTTDASPSYTHKQNEDGYWWVRSVKKLKQPNSTQMATAKSAKFKVGDIVIGKASASDNYSLTREGWVGKVTHTEDSDGDIHVVPHKGSEGRDRGHFVQAKHFKLLESGEKKKPVNNLDLSQLDALVLEKATKDEIISVLKQFKNHDKLFTEWGLGEVIEYGKGMTFLFYGAPGTGKTWAAHCIAKATGKEIMQVSVDQIQSSEPGAANRNIVNAFSEAKSSGKILFIDECDSLITNRADLGMVLAGEVNTLLTEIEKFEGILVLATNRVEHMDEALERRISLIVEFPEPDYDNRVAIWQRMLPKKMPLAKGVAAESLAEHKLTGGQIKNAVLQAARLALATEAKAVTQDNFNAAIERVLASKNLLGSASRYHQHRVESVGVSSGVQKERGISSFLDKMEDDIDEEKV